MFAIARLTIAALAVAAIFAMACRGADGGEAPEVQAIPERTAKDLAIARYRELFSGKFLRNPVDGQYYPFPALSVADVNQVEKQDGAFVLRVAPPSGVSLEVRVDRTGQWIELRRVSFAAE